MKQKGKFSGCHSVLDTESMLSLKMDTGFHRYDKKHQGFTLVELVIVIIIVGILSLVAVPIYRNYVAKAKETEMWALLSAIWTAERLYYTEYGQIYVYGSAHSVNTVLGIDARTNKYYKLFAMSGNLTPGTIEGAIIIGDRVEVPNLVGGSVVFYNMVKGLRKNYSSETWDF